MHTLLLIAALFAPPVAPTSHAEPAGPVTRLPHYTAQALTGAPRSLRKAWRGRPLVVHLWATWCIPCLDELPTLETTLGPWIARGGAVVNVSVDRDRANLERLLDEQDLVGYTLWDPTDEAALAFGIDTLPSTFVYDRRGTLLYLKLGPLDPTDPALKTALTHALRTRESGRPRP